MFLTIICLAVSFFFGYFVCRFFVGGGIAKGDLFLISMVVGLVIMSYSVLLLAVVLKSLSAAVYLFILAGAVAYFLPLKNFIKNLKAPDKISVRGILTYLKKIKWIDVSFVGLMLLIFFDLFRKTLLFYKGGYWVASEGTGDIPFHMNYVSYFIHNQPFALEEPIYSGINIVCHFIIDFLSACFYTLNGDYVFSFHLPTVILGFLAIILFYSIISKLVKNTYIRICTFLVSFFGTGVGFMKIFYDNNILAQKNIFNYLLHLPYSLGLIFSTQYPDQNILWSTFLTMCFMHQRAFLFGLPVVLSCVIILYSISKNTDNKKAFYLLGFLIGVLPLIQIYSFVAAAVITLGFMISSAISRRKNLFFGFLKTLIVSVVFALPSFVFLFLTKKTSDVQLRLGWMMGSFNGVNLNPKWKIHIIEWFDFIWRNSGLFLPLLLAAILYIFLVKKVWREKSIFTMSLALGSLLLWAVLNTVRLQTWDFDDYKIYAYFLLIGAPVVGLFFDQLEFKWKKITIFILTVFMTLSGVIIVLSHSSLASPGLFEIYNKDDAAAANWIIKQTLPSDRILIAPGNINLVNSLAGRPVILGDFMWIWTHGLDWNTRYGDIEKMYQDPGSAVNIFRKYDITYVLISGKERNDLKADEKFFDENFPVVFSVGDKKIYKISGTQPDLQD